MCAYFATEYDNDEFLQGLLANLFFIIDNLKIKNGSYKFNNDEFLQHHVAEITFRHR